MQGSTNMENHSEENRAGGTSVTIGDCRIWAEISYLDSPTDYREFLPCPQSNQRSKKKSDLVLLDDRVAFFNGCQCQGILLLAGIAVGSPLLLVIFIILDLHIRR